MRGIQSMDFVDFDPLTLTLSLGEREQLVKVDEFQISSARSPRFQRIDHLLRAFHRL